MQECLRVKFYQMNLKLNCTEGTIFKHILPKTVELGHFSALWRWEVCMTELFHQRTTFLIASIKRMKKLNLFQHLVFLSCLEQLDLTFSYCSKECFSLDKITGHPFVLYRKVGFLLTISPMQQSCLITIKFTWLNHCFFLTTLKPLIFLQQVLPVSRKKKKKNNCRKCWLGLHSRNWNSACLIPYSYFLCGSQAFQVQISC